MGIVGAFMVPHPPLIVPEVGHGREKGIADTIKAYEKVADMVAELKPDTIVVSTPHSVMYSDYFHISPGETAEGSFADFGAPQVGIGADYDTAFVRKLCMLAAENEVDAGTGGQKNASLDHGTLIPLYFITKKYVDFDLVRIGLSGLPLTDHYKLGMLVKQAAQELNRRVVYIASGDLSHKLKEDGPYGFVPDGPVYEERIMDVMGRAAFEELFDFDELFLEKVAECGHRSFVIMAGALDKTKVKTSKLSHEGPFGVGYGVCTYEVQPGEDGKNRLVWMFPIRPVPMNDVKKPAMFVFKDMDDYKARGKNVDAEYNKTHIKKSRKSTGKSDIRRVKHKTFGEGTVIDIKDGFIIVNFEKAGRKQLNYKMCMDKGLIEFL